jgi:YidC/Oxa1 family membrane protein insertase
LTPFGRSILVAFVLIAITALSNPGLAVSLAAASHTANHPPSQPLTPRGDFGRLAPIAWPLYLTLRFFYGHVVHNWGAAIVLLTVCVNLLLIWPRIQAVKSSTTMKRLQPRIQAIQMRYLPLAVADPRRATMNAEIASIYKSEQVNMLSGCLPLLVQMPLLFALFSVFKNASELHHAKWLWLGDLALPDPLHILPALIILSMTVTQLISPSPGIDPAQRKLLALLTGVIFGCTLWKYAAGLSLYWATGNLINLIVQLAINHSRLGRQMRASPRE